MLCPAKRTAALSARRRAPSQVEHSASPMNCAYQRFDQSLCVVEKRRIMRGITPSQVTSSVPLPERLFQPTRYLVSPLPNSTACRCFAGSFFHGLSQSIARAERICPMNPLVQPTFCEAPAPHGTTAPSSMLFSGSGTTRAGSMATRVPRPLQSGHMPCGLLKLKACGVSSGNEMPHFGHAAFSEKV